MSLGLCLLAGLAFGMPTQDPKPKATGVNDALPRPDGKPADVSKTVKVFILMGQSNMLEMGNVAGDKDGTLEHAVKKEGLYPFLSRRRGQMDDPAGRSVRGRDGQRRPGQNPGPEQRTG